MCPTEPANANVEPARGAMVEVADGQVTVGGYQFDQVAYGLSQTARMVGVTRQHLDHQRKLGNLRVVKIGARALVPAVEIARLLSEADTDVDLLEPDPGAPEPPRRLPPRSGLTEGVAS